LAGAVVAARGLAVQAASSPTAAPPPINASASRRPITRGSFTSYSSLTNGPLLPASNLQDRIRPRLAHPFSYTQFLTRPHGATAKMAWLRRYSRSLPERFHLVLTHGCRSAARGAFAASLARSTGGEIARGCGRYGRFSSREVSVGSPRAGTAAAAGDLASHTAHQQRYASPRYGVGANPNRSGREPFVAAAAVAILVTHCTSEAVRTRCGAV